LDPAAAESLVTAGSAADLGGDGRPRRHCARAGGLDQGGSPIAWRR
jgi:hypothetical protein